MRGGKSRSCREICVNELNGLLRKWPIILVYQKAKNSMYLTPDEDLLLKCKDRSGISVFLGKEQWFGHIIVHHSEMEGYLSLVCDGVRHPDLFHRDPKDRRVRLYYLKIEESIRPFPKAKYLLVVVKYVFESRMDFRKVGYVSSAYFVNEVKKRGESL